MTGYLTQVKFRLSIGGNVEVRPHVPCCSLATPPPPPISIATASITGLMSSSTAPQSLTPGQTPRSYICDCLPPALKIEPFPNAEYRCLVPTWLDTWPPVGPKHLAHLIKCPGIIDEKQTWIYDLIPKRLHNKLTGYTDKPSEGWGLYFEEGWDVDSMVTISFILFVVASLLFGICYSVLE